MTNLWCEGFVCSSRENVGRVLWAKVVKVVGRWKEWSSKLLRPELVV